MPDIHELERRVSADPDDETAAIELAKARARLGDARVFLEPLADRETWNTTPLALQDRAIEQASIKLGSAFEHFETQEYACGDQTHRVGGFLHRASGSLFHLLPGGQYTMGCMDFGRSEQPAHKVTLRPFMIGRFAVTQGVWQRLRKRKGEVANKRMPVIGTSHRKIRELLARRWAEDGLRLPSEAEWEYACRAGTMTDYCYGNSTLLLGRVAWFWTNSESRVQPVGLKEPNAFGLYDVHGNVSEFCRDSAFESYQDGPTSNRARLGNNIANVVCRGGSWKDKPGDLRSSRRYFVGGGSHRFPWVGFRLARDFRLDE